MAELINEKAVEGISGEKPILMSIPISQPPKGWIPLPGKAGYFVPPRQSTDQKSQGKEITSTLQAPNLRSLNRLISNMRKYATDSGMDPIRILEKGKDPDGGFRAIVVAHNQDYDGGASDGWAWSSAGGYTYGGTPVSSGPATTPGVAYVAAQDTGLQAAGLVSAPTPPVPAPAPAPAPVSTPAPSYVYEAYVPPAPTLVSISKPVPEPAPAPAVAPPAPPVISPTPVEPAPSAGFTKEDLAFIEARGGIVGVVSELEAAKIEATYAPMPTPLPGKTVERTPAPPPPSKVVVEPTPAPTPAPAPAPAYVYETVVPPAPAPLPGEAGERLLESSVVSPPITPTPGIVLVSSTEAPSTLPPADPRAFKPDPSWKAQVTDAQGNVTEYLDPAGVRHYTPFSGNWQAGFKTDVEIRQAQEKAPAGDWARLSPNVTVKNAEGIDIQLTRKEVSDLQKIVEPEQRFDQLKLLGLVAKDAEFAGADAQGNITYKTGAQVRLETDELLKVYTPIELAEIRSGLYRIYDPKTDQWVVTTKTTVEARETAGYTPEQLREISSGQYQVYNYQYNPDDPESKQWIPVTKADVENRGRYYTTSGNTLADTEEIASGLYKIYNYDTNEYVSVPKRIYGNREEFYKQAPGIGPPGTPGKITPAEAKANYEQQQAILSELRSAGFATEVGKLQPGEFGPEVPEGLKYQYSLIEALQGNFNRDKLVTVFGESTITNAEADIKALEILKPFLSIEEAAVSRDPKVLEAVKRIYPKEYEELEWKPSEAYYQDRWTYRDPVTGERIITGEELQQLIKDFEALPFDQRFLGDHPTNLVTRPTLREAGEQAVALAIKAFVLPFKAGEAASKAYNRLTPGQQEWVDAFLKGPEELRGKEYDNSPLMLIPAVRELGGVPQAVTFAIDKVVDSQEALSSWAKSQEKWWGQFPAEVINKVYGFASSMGAIIPLQVLSIMGEQNTAEMINKAASLGVGLLTWPAAVAVEDVKAFGRGTAAGIGAIAGDVVALYAGPKLIHSLLKGQIQKTESIIDPRMRSFDTIAFEAGVARPEVSEAMTAIRGRALIEAGQLITRGETRRPVTSPDGRVLGEVAKVGHDVVFKDLEGTVIFRITSMQRLLPDILYGVGDNPLPQLTGAKAGKFVVGKTGVELLSEAERGSMQARGEVMFVSQKPAAEFGERYINLIRTAGLDVGITPDVVLEAKINPAKLAKLDRSNPAEFAAEQARLLMQARKEAFFEWAKTPEATPGAYNLTKGYGEFPFKMEDEWQLAKVELIPIKPDKYSGGTIKFPESSETRLIKQLLNQLTFAESDFRSPITEPTTGKLMHPRVTVIPMVESGAKQGVVLVRSKASGLPGDVWESVGGGIEPTGSVKSNAIREVGEELGVTTPEGALEYLGLYKGKMNQYALSGSKVFVQHLGKEIPGLKSTENVGMTIWDGKSRIKVTQPVYDVLKGLAERYPNKFDITKLENYKPKERWVGSRDTEFSKTINKPTRLEDYIEAFANERQLWSDRLAKIKLEDANLTKLAKEVSGDIAHLTTRHPITGQKVPMLVFGTKAAIAEGKGVPGVKAKYKAEAYQRTVQALRELVSSGVRPVELSFTEGGEGAVSPLTSKFTAIELKEAKGEISKIAKQPLKAPSKAEYSTMAKEQKAGATVIMRLKDTKVPSVRKLDLSEATYIPKNIAADLLQWLRESKDAIVYGSFVSRLFNPKAKLVNDLDVILRDPLKEAPKVEAILAKTLPRDSYRVKLDRGLDKEGFVVELKDSSGVWNTMMDARSYKGHELMWAKKGYGLKPSGHITIDGVKFETLGTQLGARGATIMRSGLLDRLQELNRAKDIPRFRSDAEYLIEQSSKTPLEKAQLRQDLDTFLEGYKNQIKQQLAQKTPTGIPIVSPKTPTGIPIVSPKTPTTGPTVIAQVQKVLSQASLKANKRAKSGESFDEAYRDEYNKLMTKPLIIHLNRYLYPGETEKMTDGEVHQKYSEVPPNAVSEDIYNKYPPEEVTRGESRIVLEEPDLYKSVLSGETLTVGIVEIATTPEDKATTEEEILPPGEEIVTAEEEEETPTEEVVTTPEEAITTPEEEGTPTEEIIKSPEEAVVPGEEVIVPTEEVITPTEEVVAPTEEVITPTEEPYVPLEEPYVPPEEPYVPPEKPYVPPEKPYIPPEKPYEPYDPYKPGKTIYPPEPGKTILLKPRKGRKERVPLEELEGAVTFRQGLTWIVKPKPLETSKVYTTDAPPPSPVYRLDKGLPRETLSELNSGQEPPMGHFVIPWGMFNITYDNGTLDFRYSEKYQGKRKLVGTSGVVGTLDFAETAPPVETRDIPVPSIVGVA